MNEGAAALFVFEALRYTIQRAALARLACRSFLVIKKADKEIMNF
jgi:hypothetical protein